MIVQNKIVGFFRNSNDPIWIGDMSGRTIFANSLFIKSFKLKNILFNSIYHIFPKNISDLKLLVFFNLYNKKIKKLVTLNDDVFNVEVSKLFINGYVILKFNILGDDLESPNNNLDLSIYKQIVDTMQEGVWVGDEDGNTVYANDKFLEMVEYDLEEIIGKPSFFFWDEESIKTIKKHLEYRKKGEITSYEGNLKSKSGRLISVYLSGTPLANGGSAGIMTDLSNIKSLEKAKKDLEEHLEKVVSLKNELSTQIDALNNSAIVLELDNDFNILFFNEYFKKLSLGKEVGDKFNFLYLFNEDEYLDSSNIIEDVKKGKIWYGEIKLSDNAGNDYYFSTSISPFMDKNNKIYKIVVIGVDITEVKKLSHTKDEFLNITSHELRTPLTAIRGYLSMLLDGDAGKLNKQSKKFITKAFISSTNMLDIVNSMLDLAKLKSGKMIFKDSKFVLNSLLKEIYDEYKIILNDKGIDFILDLPENDILVNVDKIRIKQVIANLISNAYKFTNSGGTIYLSAKQDETNSNVIVSVKDTGVGIPDDFIDKIFDKFTQVENSLQRKTTGTGIGLNISKLILEHYNSKFIIKSKLGEGSEFSFPLNIDN